MAHTLAMPARSVTKVTWFETAATGAPVVKLHSVGRPSPPPPALVMPVPSATSKVVFAGSGPDGTNCRTRPPPSSVASSPGRVVTETLPATSGTMVSASPPTESGSIGRSKTTAMGETGATPSMPSAGTSVSTTSPGATVVNCTEIRSDNATPATSAASSWMLTS